VRIIAGEWGGRRLEAPKGRIVRPTSDRAREAWMSIVHPLLPGARVLDLYAGTGALGLEALSRGAAFVDFVERSASVARVLERNVAALGAGPRCAVHVADALRFLATPGGRPRYDVAFADPPYGTDDAERLVRAWLAAPFAAVLGVEHDATRPLPDGGDARRYGDTGITLYRV